MKENRCFNCHKIGHRVKDCQTKQQIAKPSKEKAMVKYEGKKTANTTRALISNGQGYTNPRGYVGKGKQGQGRGNKNETLAIP